MGVMIKHRYVTIDNQNLVIAVEGNICSSPTAEFNRLMNADMYLPITLEQVRLLIFTKDLVQLYSIEAKGRLGRRLYVYRIGRTDQTEIYLPGVLADGQRSDLELANIINGLRGSARWIVHDYKLHRFEGAGYGLIRRG